MAYFNIRMYSNELKRGTYFDMIVPNDPNKDYTPFDNEHSKRPMKTLFLLHGYSGSAGSWIADYLCDKYNFAVVMPNGENSFYLNGRSTGHRYCDFVGIELVDYIRKTFGLAQNADDTYILGYSMGGFGAIHTALTFPDRFGKLGAMSSALITHEVAGMKEGTGNFMANYEYYLECFGEPEKLLGSENDPECLAKRIKESGGKLPDMYLCCGKDDFLIENNREFHKFLEDNKIPHIYKESEGVHDMNFWIPNSEKIIDWMFEGKLDT